MENVKKSSYKQRDTFHFLTGINRDIVKPHVKTLETSLKLMKQTRPVVVTHCNFIDGIRRRYVIDGQHLIEALTNLAMDIYYIEVPVKNEQDLIAKIAFFNATSKAWLLPDYVKAWSWLPDTGSPYKRLLKAHGEFKTSINTLTMNFNCEDRVSSTKRIKAGTFTLSSPKVGYECARYFTEVLKEVPNRGHVPTRILATVFSHWYHEHYISYNHDKFLAHVRKNRDTIRIFADNNDEAQDFMNRFGGRGRIIDLTAATGT